MWITTAGITGFLLMVNTTTLKYDVYDAIIVFILT